MAQTLAGTYTAEPESVFPQQDAQVSDLYTQFYQTSQGYQQYPVLSAYSNTSIPTTVPSGYGMNMQMPQRTHSYDSSSVSSLSSYSTPATSYWSASPLPSQGPTQFYAAQQQAYYGHAVQPLTAQSYGPTRNLGGAIGHDGSGLGLSYEQEKHGRSQSFVSSSSSQTIPTSDFDTSNSETSRASSPSTSDLTAYGYLNQSGTWSCNYPGCTSKAVFTRGCDLRKHHKRHTKSFFCRYPGCAQSCGGGFSSKKDLARHEAKHNPGVVCEWQGCDRIFSRVDNMVSLATLLHLPYTIIGANRFITERSR